MLLCDGKHCRFTAARWRLFFDYTRVYHVAVAVRASLHSLCVIGTAVWALAWRCASAECMLWLRLMWLLHMLAWHCNIAVWMA